MTRFVLALSLLVLVSACGKKEAPPRVSGGSGAGGGETIRPAGPNWSAMLKKVPNLDSRKTKILELMQDAVSEYDHYKRSEKAGSPDRKRLQAAQEHKVTAGDLYDELQEDFEEAAGSASRGEQLWSKRMGTFQTKFDSLSKKVRRIEFK